MPSGISISKEIHIYHREYNNFTFGSLLRTSQRQAAVKITRVAEVNGKPLTEISSLIICVSGIDRNVYALVGKGYRQRGRRVFDTKISG